MSNWWDDIHVDRGIVLTATDISSPWNGLEFTYPAEDANLDFLQLNTEVWGVVDPVTPDQVVVGSGETTVRVSNATLGHAGPGGGDTAIIGKRYDMSVTLSRPFVRDEQGHADLDARFFIERITARYHRTGALTLRATYPNVPGLSGNYDQSLDLYGNDNEGALAAWFKGRAQDMHIILANNTSKPCAISSIEFVGDYSSGVME